MATRKQKPAKKRTQSRRHGRTWALSLLYADEYNRQSDETVEAFPEMVAKAQKDEDALAFARELYTGVMHLRNEIDERVQKSSPRWKIPRMDTIDRNILRLAAFELFHRTETPPRVVINEAVELAKRFGAEQTRNFVNGILQQVCIDNDISL